MRDLQLGARARPLCAFLAVCVLIWEWTKSRVVFTQFQHVSSNNVDQFKDTSHEVIVWPSEYASGKMIYPYAEAKKQ